MHFQKNTKMKRDTPYKQIFIGFLALLIIFSSTLFWEKTEAEIISSGPIPKLTQVGPIDEGNGFPLWYKDSNGAKQELCLDTTNSICGLVSEGTFNANLPISFPDNYPGEAFYQLAEASMEAGDGRGDAIGTFALEATFNGGDPLDGDQTVFGRIRFRIDNLTTGAEYIITHPYGADRFIAEPEDEDEPNGPGEISYVEDIGAGQGFDGAMDSRIGTFLKWNPTVGEPAPEGYVGDPDIPHEVVGGVNNQNSFKIEGPGIGNSYPAYRCSPDSTDCIETKLFSLAGKIATKNGLDIQQATYSQTDKGGAIDVFVSSETEQNITVSSNGITTTTLAGGNGQYFAHVPYIGAEPPTEVTLTNIGDNPDTVKAIKLADRITASAGYDTDTKTLTVTAKSSDEIGPPTLTVKEYGQNISPETGTLVISDLSYIPPAITINSTFGGTVTIPVNINSIPVTPVPVTASAGVDQTITAGGEVTEVTLNGSNSTGPIESHSWKQLSGPETVELSNANTATAKFAIPTKPGVYVFELTVTGPFVTSTSTTKVTILGSDPGPGPDPDPDPDPNPNPDPDPNTPAPVAKAGLDQTDVRQGTTVTLDGSKSLNAASYSWTQTGGPSVQLLEADTPKPTFNSPKKVDTLTFQLTVTGSDGKTSTDDVVVSTKRDNLSVTLSEYRSRSGWRIEGKSDVFGPDVEVTITLVDSANPQGRIIGTAEVDALGEWKYRSAGATIRTGGTITVESSSGGKLTGVEVISTR